MRARLSIRPQLREHTRQTISNLSWEICVTSTRVVVISDLHLTGDTSNGMISGDRLALFLRSLPTRLEVNERLHLILNGDIVDFCAMGGAWTPDPKRASSMLQSVVDANGDVFDALAALCSAGHTITVVVGNHDVELTMDSVQSVLRRRFGPSERNLRFYDDGRALLVGGVLIEHGNRYDAANLNDWGGLRAHASAISRGEEHADLVKVSAGSVVVEKVVNVLKAEPHGYTFVDLLEPQGELTAVLMLSLEPRLIQNIPAILSLIRAGSRRLIRPKGADGVREVSGDDDVSESSAVATEFLRQELLKNHIAYAPGVKDVSSAKWSTVLASRSQHSVAEILRCGGDLPVERLRAIRKALLPLVSGDRSDDLQGPAGPYGAAAKRMLDSGVADVVVMGHTHHPRRIAYGNGVYINCGTWTDAVRIESSLLEDDVGFRDWVYKFVGGCSSLRSPRAWFADIRLGSDGQVHSAELGNAR